MQTTTTFEWHREWSFRPVHYIITVTRSESRTPETMKGKDDERFMTEKTADAKLTESRLKRDGCEIGSRVKAGVIGLTKALAKEVATEGILVNAVAPAVIGTDMLQQMEKSTVDMLVAKIPMGRVGKPEEVAALVAWLASDECSFSTGAVYDLSGGRATY